MIVGLDGGGWYGIRESTLVEYSLEVESLSSDEASDSRSAFSSSMTSW